MADASERISQLKIDRSSPPPARRSWLVPGIAVLAIAIGAAWWLFLRPGSSAVTVEIDTARKPPSVAAGAPVAAGEVKGS